MPKCAILYPLTSPAFLSTAYFFSPTISNSTVHPLPKMPDTNTNNAQHAAKHKKKRNIIILAVVASFLLVAVIAATITITQKNTISSKAHGLIKSTCASTLYPDLCVSSLVATPSATSTITSPIDVITAALKLTISNVRLNKGVIKKIAARKSLTKREVQALKDCIQTVEDSIDELERVAIDLKKYGSKNYSIDDLMILLSAAMTNQQTCIDGFSHDEGDKGVRSGLLEGQLHVFRLCSNVLAMIKNRTTDTTAATAHEQVVEARRLEEKEDGWPKWLSAGDRRLLQATTVTPDVTVAADGSGNYRTVSEAVAAAPSGRTTRYIIRVKAGVYRENVEIPKAKTNLMFVGDGRTTTIITANRNVVDGSTTFNSATVAVVGDRFLARDITFQNTAGPSKHQAVALRVNADFTAFYRCDMIAFQDTLYVHSFRQFYVNCIIIGTVDFIFGNAAVVIQDCDIHARRPNPGQKNMVTAQGRDDPNENTGIVIQKCRIGATSDLQGQQATYPTYLGRPWKEYSRTVIMQSVISDIINPAGWFEWDGNFALSTLYYAEYANTGPGADTSHRVTWPGYHVLTSATQAQPFTAGNFISGGNWLASTGFPFSLGL